MRISTLRRIDYYFGPIICRGLLTYKFILDLIPSNLADVSAIENCRNILVIKFFGMGTILLASPSLRGLKERYPSAKITILTLPVNRELCTMLPSLDDVMCLSIDSPLKFLVSFTKALFTIKKRKFDIVIDLEFLTNFSSLVVLLATLLARPKLTVGFNSPIKWRNDTHAINVSFDHSRHITKIFEKVVRSLHAQASGASFGPEKKSLLDNMDTEYMDKLARANPALGACTFFVCVNINAGELSLHRRWPKEYFAKIIDELIKKPDIAILLTGGKIDVGYVSEFKKSLLPSPRLVNVCGQTSSIRELTGMFKKCDLLVTNDSGPLHLAYIVGLDTISFFGPETPYLYGPIENRHRVFYEDLYCSPCLNIYNSKTSDCKRNICLISIRPEAVLKVIEDKYLASKKNRAAKDKVY